MTPLLNSKTTKELKVLLKADEERLKVFPGIWLGHFRRSDSWPPSAGKPISVAITQRFLKKCKKGKVWNTPEMHAALQNTRYGFDENQPKSAGGSDGVFLLTREHKPKNEMMRKMFDQFIDKPGSGAEEVAMEFGTTLDKMTPVRVVSHHMRLLGLLFKNDRGDALVLIDYDNTK